MLIWIFKKIILLPGVIVHELSHYVMCKLLGVKVKKVHITSHVEFVIPKSIIKSMLVSIAPTLFGYALSLYLLYSELTWIRLYFAWVIIYVSVPSKSDTQFLQHHNIFKKILFFPFFVLFRIFHHTQTVTWIRFWYTAVVVNVLLFLQVLLS